MIGLGSDKNTPRIIQHFQRYLERSWAVLTTWIKGTVLRSGRGVREGKQISGPEGITHEHFTFVFCNLSFELVRSDCRTSSGKRSNLTGHAISECSWVSLYVLKMLSMRPHATLSIAESLLNRKGSVAKKSETLPFAKKTHQHGRVTQSECSADASLKVWHQ